jgi:hypothetical protein
MTIFSLPVSTHGKKHHFDVLQQCATHTFGCILETRDLLPYMEPRPPAGGNTSTAARDSVHYWWREEGRMWQDV